MSDEISFEDAWGIKPTQNNSSEISFEDAWGLPKKKEGRGVGGFLKDTAIDATKGVVGFGESAVGLADIATGNIVGKGLAEVGYDPATTKKVLNSGYSPERQLANQNVSDAKGFVPTVKALVENPSTAFGSIVESAPMSLGGAGVARTVGTRMLSSALAKAGIAEGTPAATAFATKFFSNPATLAKLTAVGAGAEGATTTGQIQEQGRQAGKEWSDTILPAAAAGVGTAAIGVLSSKVPGLHDAEAALAIAGRSGERATILQAGKNIAKTMFKEGVLEEMPQSYQEQVFTNLALGRPWDEGAAEAAGQGLVVGAFQGGGMEAGAQAINRASQAKQDESLDPAVRDIEQAFKPKQEVSQVTPGVKSQVIDGPLPVIPQGEGATDVVQNGITTSLQPVNDANSTTLEPESGVNIQSGLIPTTTGVISNALSKGWLPSTVAEEDQGLNEYATQRQAAQDYNQKRNEQSMPTGWAYDSKGEVDNRFTGNEINKQYSTYNPTVPGNEDEAKVDGWIHNSIAAGMTKDEVDEAVARQVSLEYNQRKNAKPDPKLGWLFDNPQDVTNRLIRRRIDDLYETYNPTIPGQSEGAAQPEGNRGWMRDATPQQDAGLNEYRNQANASREYNQERNAKKTGWMQKEAPISKQEFAYDNYNPEIPQTPTVRGWVHTITPTVEPLKNGLVRVKGDKAQIKAQAVAAGIKPVLYGKGGWVFGKKNAEAVKDLFDMKAKMQRGAQIASATNPLKPATVNGSIDIGEGSKTVKKGAQKQYVSVAAMVSENRPAETDLRPLLTGIDSFADTINLSKDKRNGYAKEIINAGTADEAKQTAEAIHAELSLSAEKKGNTTAPQEQKKPAQVEPTKQAKVSPQVAKLQADIADYESMRGRATDTTAIDDAIAEKKAELAQLEKSSKPTIREKLQAKREEKLNKALPTPLSKDEAQLGNAGKMASPGAESFTQQPTQQPTENAVAPVVDEKELERVELIRKWGDKWQYRTYPGKNWYYANSQDGAIEQASKTYNKSPKESLLTPSERYDKTNADSFSEMDKMYGRNSIPELEKLLSDAGKAKAGYNLKEFDQNGGRRTTAAVTNQGIRDAGEFSLKMGIYLKERVEREKAKTTKKLATESEKKPISEMTAATGQDHIADATKMIAAQDHNEQALDMVQRATPSKSVVKDSLATEAIYEKETPEKVAEKIEPKKAGKPQSVYDKIRELSVEEQQAVWTMTLKKGDKFYLGKHSYEVTANTEKTFRVRREDGKNATAKKYGNSRLSGEGLWSSLTRDIEGQITVDLLAQYNQFHKVSDIFRLTEKAIAEYEAGDTFNSIDGIDSELKQFQRETQDNPNDDRNMELVKVAKKFFGTTTDPKRAGYILQDGTMLDFSGAHQVDPASRRYMQDRAVDHRDLHSDSMLTPGVELDIAMSGTWGMMEFMARTGAIRFDYVSGIANAFTDPTAAQVKLIGRHLRGMDITLESVDKETGKIKHSAEIDNATPMKVAKFFADAKTKTVDSQSSYYSIDAPTISDTISQKTHEDVAGITNAYQLLTMAAQNGNAATSALAKLLRKTISDEKLLNTPVSFAKVAHSSYHVSKGITIALKDADALAYNTMLHEAVHGITVKEMKSSPILRMQVKQMMKQVGRKVDAKLLTLAKESEGQSKKFLDKAQGKGFTDEEMATAYALSSPEEFLAQAFSSKSFQELLKSIPSTHSTDSTIKTLWDKLVKFIGKALGITDRNMLSDVIATVVHIGQHEVSVDYKRSGSNLSVDAWHGTPHKVDKFSSSKIGTGEGAQAYGHGLYFAGAKEVGEFYRKSLAGSKVPDVEGIAKSHNVFPIGREMRIEIMRQGKDESADDQKAAKRLQNASIEARLWPPGRLAAIIKDYRKELKGNLYQVELAPDEDEFLLWDNPLSEQSEKVVAALENKFSLPSFNEDFRTAGEFYKSREKKFNSQKKASDELHSLGIRGIKYLDGSSRNSQPWSILSPEENTTGKWKVSQFGGSNRQLFDSETAARKFMDKQNEQAFNYVIFNEDDVKITGANGEPLSIDTPEQTAANNAFSGKDFIDRIIKDKPKWNERFENFVYNWLNTNDPRKRIYAKADKKTAKNDMVTVEELRGKKTAEEIKRTRETVVEPMLKELAEAKLTVSDLEEYGHGLHASERNQRMREVRAKMTLDSFLKQMTGVEAEKWKQSMSDLRTKTVMDDDLDTKDTQQGYMQLIDQVIADISSREEKVNARQEALDSRLFTDEETDKGTPERLQAAIDNTRDQLEVTRGLQAKWADESPRLSGMTDEEGQAIIDKWEADPRFNAMQSAKTKLDRINRMGVEALHDSGELSDDEYNGIVNGYKHYVPLMREGFLDTTPTVGRITGPTGKPLKVAMGSMREVVNIVAHSVQNYETSVNRKHKAAAGQALYQFVLDSPDSGMTVEKVAKQPAHDKEGNVVMYPSMVEPENGVYVKVQVEKMVRGEKKMVSEKKLIMFDTDQRTPQGRTVGRFLDSIKGQDAQLGPYLSKLATLNRYLAMINTMVSPEFVLSNFVRDFQTAFVHLSDEKIRGDKGFRTKIAKDIFPAIKGIYSAEKGDDSSSMGQWYREFAKEGGKIGWMQGYEKIEDLANELEHTMKLYGEGHTMLKKIDAMKKLVSNSNTAVENGVRLATYKNLVESGVEKSKAASIASKLTVDFTQKGKQGPILNSLYLFSNAGIQGNLRMIHAIRTSKKVQQIVSGIVVGGFALQLLALASGGDDDSGEPYVLGLPDFVRERNMIFMIPGTKGKYISIPMPYGYNGFNNIGAEVANMLYMAITGRKYNTAGGAMRVMTTFANAFNPLASGTILQTISPTVFDPVVMAKENKNFMGNDLMPQQSPFGPEKPDSERYWKNVSPTSKFVTSIVNRMTGGDKFKGGLVDMSPETLDMLYDTVTGSTGKFVSNVLHLPVRAATGELETQNVPFARRFAGAWNDRAISNRYYEAVKGGDIAKQRYDGAETPFERAKVAASDDFKIYRRSKMTEKQLTNLRKSLKLAEARKDKERTETIKNRITSVQMNFLNRMEN